MQFNIILDRNEVIDQSQTVTCSNDQSDGSTEIELLE